MGFRIHKAVGYGMFYTGLHELFDRLDENGIDGEVGKLIADAVPLHKGEHLFLEDEQFAIKNYTNVSYPKKFYDCVKSATYDEDEGYLLVFPPIHINEWFRWDDIIDYCENTEDENTDFETKVKLLDRPIYPYRDWMNPETFENIPFADVYEYKYEGAKVPAIPLSVKLISDKVGIDWKQLKPMVATWWS